MLNSQWRKSSSPRPPKAQTTNPKNRENTFHTGYTFRAFASLTTISSLSNGNTESAIVRVTFTFVSEPRNATTNPIACERCLNNCDGSPRPSHRSSVSMGKQQSVSAAATRQMVRREGIGRKRSGVVTACDGTIVGCLGDFVDIHDFDIKDLSGGRTIGSYNRDAKCGHPQNFFGRHTRQMHGKISQCATPTSPQKSTCFISSESCRDMTGSQRE